MIDLSVEYVAPEGQSGGTSASAQLEEAGDQTNDESMWQISDTVALVCWLFAVKVFCTLNFENRVM